MLKKPLSTSFLPLLMLALVVWGSLLAIGAFLGPEFWTRYDPDSPQVARTVQPSFDLRKPLIIGGTMALFLGGWGLAIRSRNKRLEKEAANQAEAARYEAPP